MTNRIAELKQIIAQLLSSMEAGLHLIPAFAWIEAEYIEAVEELSALEGQS